MGVAHGLEELEAVRPDQDTAVAIGVFDGVHLGHRHLLQQVRALAARNGLASAVLTFRNHPLTVLRPDIRVTYLCSLEQRLALLHQTGVDHIIPLTFTHELSQRTAREFVSALVQRVRMRWLLCGPDFALGKGREGTVPVLKALGKELGFSVASLEPFTKGGRIVSSTAVREALAGGDVKTAAGLLGRAYSLAGPVVVGDRRGRALGFPTANLDVPQDIALPADGIYCTIAWVEGQPRHSVSSIGVRPTFGGDRRTIETYILDFEADLYGKMLTIDLVERIRAEERFATVEALIAQMQRDVLLARDLFAAQAKL